MQLYAAQGTRARTDNFSVRKTNVTRCLPYTNTHEARAYYGLNRHQFHVKYVHVGIYVGCSLATSSNFELQLCGKVAAGKLVTVQYTKPKDERTSAFRVYL